MKYHQVWPSSNVTLVENIYKHTFKSNQTKNTKSKYHPMIQIFVCNKYIQRFSPKYICLSIENYFSGNINGGKIDLTRYHKRFRDTIDNTLVADQLAKPYV